ncbi:isopenicillin N synthase family dioxygenase [Ramlibacter rhizophilus]|uniref:2-oxoglutarate-dependent ethylene/succinate-forming enzyme n=1 Tax=Ramlibacter rhizophilus TaxID=1781167 RepID=A0A4Z0BHE2_9BURK|nr:2-oxoglutarate and iron-dependent oxygenase domain-containing protein [Ramlibacter rhizophilus]TFY97534.1 isopenicillin N synthase family oxygenase [Ramlibacter rhizophilus]
MDIPLIDIAALSSDDTPARATVAAAIGHACRDTGFFAITGHGIGPGLIEDAFDAAREVFALPSARKQALAIARHGHNRGYVALGVESLDEKAAPDLKEAFNLVWTDERSRPPNVWPPIEGWQGRMQAYFDAVLAVGRRLHEGFAMDLGLAPDFFADKLDAPQATLRLLHYPAEFGAGAPQGRAGAGTHTDYGNVTLLATDGVGGLQVQRRGGGWIDVPPLPGAFVCNIGDCLMRWSNDVYVSTPHRVLPPARERYSIAFFLDPNPDALVSAIPSCVPAGEAPRHAPVTAGEYLRQRFAATYGKAAGAG